MKRFSFLSLILLIFISTHQSAAQTVAIKVKKSSGNQYTDFACEGDTIWGLTKRGKLTRFHAGNGDPLPGKVKNSAAIIALANDKEGNIVIGDKSKAIKRYDKQTQSWTTLFKYDGELLAITFDSKNNCYLITGKGIFDPGLNKYFYPDSSRNDRMWRRMGWYHEPAFFTDKDDHIWVGFGYGEWGGDLFIFNTVDKKFILPELDSFPITFNPIKAIFEGNGSVFVTSGLMHFYTSGSIAAFDHFQSKPLFKSDTHRKFPDKPTGNELIAGEYIGPGAWNATDSCIYFYSQNGIFKGNPRNDLSKIEYWTKVLQPALHWSNGQPDAVGAPMNVTRLRFLQSGKLVFVSQNDGIGIYDGKTLTMTR